MSLSYSPDWLRSGFALSEDLPLTGLDSLQEMAEVVKKVLANEAVPSAHGLGYQAMVIGDQGTESMLVNALSQVRQFGLKMDIAHATITEVAMKVDDWKKVYAAREVRATNIDLLAQYIDGDRLRSQRGAFLAR